MVEQTLSGNRDVNDLSISVLTSIEDLPIVRNFWETHQAFPHVDFIEYCETIKSGSNEKKPDILCVRRKGELVGLVAARFERVKMSFRMGYWKVRSWPVGTLVVEHAAVMGRLSELEAEQIALDLFQALRAGVASVIQVRYLCTESPLYAALRRIPSVLCRDRVVEFNNHWRLVLPETYRQFYESRTKNTQSNIRRNSNRFLKEYRDRFRIVRYDSVHDLDAAVRAVEPIASRTYHRRLGTGFADTPEFRSAWARYARRGWLCVHALLVDDRPIAFWAGRIYNKRFVLDFTGYDPDFQSYNVGAFLWLKKIEEFCANHEVTTYDFGYSDESYKRNFGTEAIEEASFCIFAPSIEGLALQFARLMTTGATEATKTLLKQSNLLPSLKKLAKNLATRSTAPQ